MNMIALILAATLSAGNAESDSTARDGARAISLSRAREELREKGPAPGALEKAMLTRFGGPGQERFADIMVSITGIAVCIAVLAMAIYMICRSSRSIRWLKQEGYEA